MIKNYSILQNIANHIRVIGIEAILKARSGHIGMILGCAELLTYLYGDFMQYHHQEPNWINRDRFVLSAGHGALGQHILLHMAGYDISIDDLKNHRQGSTKASSHPIYNPVLGIETSTGADGYGIANAVGMALGQKILANQHYHAQKALFDEKIIVLGGDGCFMEGVSYEAAQLAGHLQLNNLIMIYDANKISLNGHIDEICSTNYIELYKAMNFEVFEIDGHDFEKIDQVFKLLRKKQKKPVLIIAHTIIGKGLLSKTGTVAAHSGKLSLHEAKAAQKTILPEYQEWAIKSDIYDYFLKKQQKIKHKVILKATQEKLPKLEQILNNFEFTDEKQAGRFLSQDVLNFLAKNLPNIYSGSADSACSDGSDLTQMGVISYRDYQGRNIKFGVREFAMSAMANGLAQTKEIIPVIGGFLAFSDYLKPGLRFAAMMKLQVICSFSHDSIFLGEDGPTHQPIEQLAMFRATPNTWVIRPADAQEIKFAWQLALSHEGPSILALARQQLKPLTVYRTFDDSMAKGAYIIHDCIYPDIVIYASGSEVSLALEVGIFLEKNKLNIRVISVPCFEVFDLQSKTYQSKILNHEAPLSVSIEAGNSLIWHKFIGKSGLAISVTDFGLSDSPQKVAQHFGFTVEKIVEKIIKYMRNELKSEWQYEALS